jgi:serine/threonine protein kinase
MGVECVPTLIWSGFKTLDRNVFCNVTEFIEGYHPKSLAELNQEEATALAKSINKLHSVGVAHGDIRERNIIFKANIVNELRCYIIDFGNSTLVTSGSLLYPKLSVKSGAAPGIDKDADNDYYWQLFESFTLFILCLLCNV